MKENPIGRRSEETHYTCTGTEFGRDLGDVENVPKGALRNLFRRLFGIEMSKDPAVQRIQGEQALARQARNERQKE
jgi:hypothetical protein